MHLASRDVIISSQICVSKLQRFSTSGDGCWLPTNPPEFAQPRLSRVKRRSSPARGVQIWVCLFLYGRSLPRHPHDRPYRNKHTQICTPSLGTTSVCPCSNGAVQIRVGLELAEKVPFWRKRRKLGFCILPTDNKVLAPQTPENDENDENAGGDSGKGMV